jgi:hypothetical protein
LTAELGQRNAVRSGAAVQHLASEAGLACVLANAAEIQPEHLDRPLVEALEEIDWGAIADHWLVLGNGYRRREKR